MPRTLTETSVRANTLRNHEGRLGWCGDELYNKLAEYELE